MIYCATLDIFSLFFLQLSRLLPHTLPFLRHPAVERVAPHLQLSCCGAHTHAFFKEVACQLFLSRHLVAEIFAASDASQSHAFGLLARQCLFGALRDEVALDLCRQSEGKGEHLALYVVAQTISVLHGPHAAFLLHAQAQYLHDHEERTPQSRQFGTDDEIAAFHSSEQRAESSVAIVACAADALFYPSVDVHQLLCAKTLDLKALVLYRLLVCAHSDVSVNHGLFWPNLPNKCDVCK